MRGKRATIAVLALVLGACTPSSGPEIPWPSSIDRPDSNREYLAYPVSTGSGPELGGVRLRTDLPELEASRSVEVVLEIDRAPDLPELPLSVSTREGRLTLAAILAEVGLAVSIVWDQTLLPGELSDEAWPGEDALRDLADRYRTLSPGEDVWHLHLVLGRRSAVAHEISLAIDSRCRRSGIVFVDPDPQAAGSALHAVVHEIGHLLNLPHPWDVYGNTRSAMTYPWRWQGWDWRDPAVYHFDVVGRRHILRNPEWFVRPGCHQPSED